MGKSCRPYLRLEIVGVVVGVVGVHWLLLQTFSHVARIQLKVLEAGDRSSQVGHDPFQLLAWVLQERGGGRFQEMQIGYSPLFCC